MPFPTELDNLPANKTDDTPAIGDHAAHHNALAAAINRTQQAIKLGTAVMGPGPSGDVTGAADVAAINAATLALEQRGGGRLMLQPGSLYWGGIDPVVPRRNVHLDFNCSMFRLAAGSTASLFKEGDGLESSWWVTGCIFDGNRANQVADVDTYLVDYTRATDLDPAHSPTQPPYLVQTPEPMGGDSLGFEKCVIHNVRGDAFQFYTSGATVRDVLIFNVTGEAFMASLVDSVCDKLEIGSIGRRGIIVPETKGDTRFDNVKVYGTGKDGWVAGATAYPAVDIRSNRVTFRGEVEECFGQGLRLDATGWPVDQCRIEGSIRGVLGDALIIDGANAAGNTIDVTIAGFYNGTRTFTPAHWLNIDDDSDRNTIRITSITQPSIACVTGDPTGNDLTLNQDRNGTQTLAYAATVTLAPLNGRRHRLELEGDVTINPPVAWQSYKGQQATLSTIQDGVGRDVTFHSAFCVDGTIPTTTHTQTTVTFEFDGSYWMQVSEMTTVALPATAGLEDPVDLATYWAIWEAKLVTGKVDGDALTVVPNRDTAHVSDLGADGANPGPIYRTDANGINGLPAMEFDGTRSLRATNVPALASQAIICAVVKLTTATRKGLLVALSAAADETIGYALGFGLNDMDTVGDEILGLYQQVAWKDPNHNMGGAGTYVVTMIVNGGTASFRVNGTAVGNAVSAVPVAPGPQVFVGRVGTRYAGAGIKAAAIGLLSGTDVADAHTLEQWFGAEYGVTIA